MVLQCSLECIINISHWNYLTLCICTVSDGTVQNLPCGKCEEIIWFFSVLPVTLNLRFKRNCLRKDKNEKAKGLKGHITIIQSW